MRAPTLPQEQMCRRCEQTHAVVYAHMRAHAHARTRTRTHALPHTFTYSAWPPTKAIGGAALGVLYVYIVMTYSVMAYIVMTYIVMADRGCIGRAVCMSIHSSAVSSCARTVYEHYNAPGCTSPLTCLCTCLHRRYGGSPARHSHRTCMLKPQTGTQTSSWNTS